MSLALKYNRKLFTVFTFFVCISIYTSALHANDYTHEPPSVSISLADTAAQKEKVAHLNQNTLHTVSRSDSKEKPGLIAKYFSILFSDENESSEIKSPEIDVQSSESSSLTGLKQRHSRKNTDFKNNYDDHFRKYSKHYFGIGADWTWFKAQAIVESELKPHAKSQSGAMGLMQIMPKTYHEIKRKNPHFGDAFDPYYSIAAGIYYNRKIYESWSQIEDPEDRRKYMFASYNAGLGSIQRTYKRAGKVTSFTHLTPLLHTAPKHYVFKIEREYKRINR